MKKTGSREIASHYRQHISITTLLCDLGYDVDPNSVEEQQIRCDLHGSDDRKPSARVYPDTNSWYCWACDKARDPVSTIKDKLSLNFWKACEELQKRYSPPPPPKINKRGEVERGDVGISEEEKNENDKKEIFFKMKYRISRLLSILTDERSLDMIRTTKLWFVFDTIVWHIEKGGWETNKGIASMDQLHSKIRSFIPGN